MKRDPLREYRNLLANVYGAKPMRAAKQASKPKRIAMSFDDGRPIRAPRVPGRGIEYSTSTETEYDVAADNPRFDPLAYQASQEVCVCAPISDARPAPTPQPSRPPEIDPATTRATVEDAPKSKASAFTQRRMRELVGDKELLADLESILDKKPEAPKPEAPARAEPPPRRAPEPVAPRPQEPPEHAIFARIAQNMQYATAYDLGSVELGRRFDTFDQPEPQLPVVRAPNS